MDGIDLKLSADLKPIYELEVDLGNKVLRIDEPAGTRCPFAIVFASPIHKKEIETMLVIPNSVSWHESADQHYERYGMAGYFSIETRHFVYGPMKSLLL